MRDQTLLLPASVEDYMVANNPVQFIDASGDDLDLGEAGFDRSRSKVTGQPGYDPGRFLPRNRAAGNRLDNAGNLPTDAPIKLCTGGLHPDPQRAADEGHDVAHIAVPATADRVGSSPIGNRAIRIR